LGNADIGLHVHIHPRYEWEDEKFKTKNPFKYYWENVEPIDFDYEKHKDLIFKIKKELERIYK
jgi:diadenosine tetraphosphate (Ap4A) HIT family hydrolase